jgi:hypothetical protein
MPVVHEEIIEDLERHIRKFGGEFGEWRVGTAKDCHGPFFQRHRAADQGDGLAYREAFTTNAAQAVVAYLVNDRGLELVPEAEACSALAKPADLKVGATTAGDAVHEAEGPSARHDPVSEPGRLVFVYRRAASHQPAPPGSDHATLHKIAA